MEDTTAYQGEAKRIMESKIEEAFFYFLRRGLFGKEEGGAERRFMREGLAREEWKRIYDMACQQAVSGILTYGIAQTDMRPDTDLWGRWIAHSLYIEQTNERFSVRERWWMERLKEAGVTAEIFKGSSVARWYPQPALRSFGDIDIVVSEGWEKLEATLQRLGIPYHASGDITAQDGDELTVEFHRWRERLYSPITDSRLRRMLRTEKGGDELYLVCLILHLRKHILSYGIGLKQVCDVAVMLRRTNLDTRKLTSILRRLHAERFSRVLFGFISSHLYEETAEFPLPFVDKGRNFTLLRNSILTDGYVLKLKQNATRNEPAFVRIARNAWTWTKRSVRLSVMMPDEAGCFLLYMTGKRIKKVFHNKPDARKGQIDTHS